MTEENEPRHRRHRIFTDSNSWGGYWAYCDCLEWRTDPRYDSNDEARRAGQDHLDSVRR